MQRRVDWAGAGHGARSSASAAQRLKPEDLAARQAWRDRRLMALAAHKRMAAKEIGN